MMIGVDIGGTNSTVGLVNGEGAVLTQTRFPTRAHEPVNQYVSRLALVINELRDELPASVLVQGASGAAGELGHMSLVPRGRACGCVETYVSASGLRRTVFALLAERTSESRLRSVAFADLTAEMVSRYTSEGDTIARGASRTPESIFREDRLHTLTS